MNIADDIENVENVDIAVFPYSAWQNTNSGKNRQRKDWSSSSSDSKKSLRIIWHSHSHRSHLNTDNGIHERILRMPSIRYKMSSVCIRCFISISLAVLTRCEALNESTLKMESCTKSAISSCQLKMWCSRSGWMRIANRRKTPTVVRLLRGGNFPSVSLCFVSCRHCIYVFDGNIYAIARQTSKKSEFSTVNSHESIANSIYSEHGNSLVVLRTQLKYPYEKMKTTTSIPALFITISFR